MIIVFIQILIYPTLEGCMFYIDSYAKKFYKKSWDLWCTLRCYFIFKILSILTIYTLFEHITHNKIIPHLKISYQW